MGSEPSRSEGHFGLSFLLARKRRTCMFLTMRIFFPLQCPISARSAYSAFARVAEEEGWSIELLEEGLAEEEKLTIWTIAGAGGAS